MNVIKMGSYTYENIQKLINFRIPTKKFSSSVLYNHLLYTGVESLKITGLLGQ